MSENTFMGVTRSRIPWYPTIDYSKCDFCMECDKFCPHKVFERKEDNPKLVVKNLENCVVFCRACSKACPLDAIFFPDKNQILALIQKIRKEEENGKNAASSL